MEKELLKKANFLDNKIKKFNFFLRESEPSILYRIFFSKKRMKELSFDSIREDLLYNCIHSDTEIKTIIEESIKEKIKKRIFELENDLKKL
jgi:hypothetical protein